ncbi:MAG: polysaccharide biosynthesis tyrosine autokinase [Pseudomonadales bacterium]|nr:polysaccharide biosynthesis tyrosine autokinase [Pseudomonadales bacterium]
MSDSQSQFRRAEQRPRWWWPLRARSRLIMLGGLPVAMVIALFGLFQPPVFESRALVEVQGGAVQTSINPVATEVIVLMNTQREIASSASVAGPYREHLQVDVVPQTYLLSVRYFAQDPQSAQQGANAVAQAYVSYTESAQLEQIQRAAEQLIAKLDNVKIRPADVTQESGGQPVDELDDATLDDLLPPLSQPGAGRRVAQLQAMAEQSVNVLDPVLETSLIRQLVKTYDDSLSGLVAVRILDSADVPRAPVQQMEPWWILLGYLGAVAVPAFFVAFRFQRRDSLDFKQDVEDRLGKRCIGVVPALNLAEPAQFMTDREYADSIGVLRARLQMQRPAHDPLEQFPRGRVVLITSGSEGEGKTSIAMNLAFAMAKTEKVLLINADMRRSQSYVGLSAGAAGLSHLIAGAAQMRDCVHAIPGKGLYVIPAGVLPPNPKELLSSARFRRIIEMLERRFDTVIIDAPSLTEVSDTLVVARHSSDILYVVQASVTRPEEAYVELSRLQGEGIPPVRVVLNRATPYDLDPDIRTSFGL